MRIAVITNSRIPSLTANSIQAMKVCQALVQNGHEIRLFAPRETEPASWEQLASHYGLHTTLSVVTRKTTTELGEPGEPG